MKNYTFSNCDAIISAAEFIHPVHVNLEKEKRQSPLLLKTYNHMILFTLIVTIIWLLIIHTNTNFKLTVKWLNGHWHMPINVILLQQSQSTYLGTKSYLINKACKNILYILPRFLKDLIHRLSRRFGSDRITKNLVNIDVFKLSWPFNFFDYF